MPALRRSRARSSDLHRACPTRLCCAFRFSQPLDALFRSTPFRPCFMPVTSLGFSRLQRVSPTGSGRGFSSSPVLRAVYRRVPKDSSAAAPRMCAPGGSVPDGAVLPAVHQADPLMALCPLRGIGQLRPRLRASTEPPLMGFDPCLARRTDRDGVCSSECQRTEAAASRTKPPSLGS